MIEILTASTQAAYKAYLRKTGVSYIIAGEKKPACEAAMKKLYELFHIEKVLICGDGVVNWSFLQAGMVDELSLFLAPVTDGIFIYTDPIPCGRETGGIPVKGDGKNR